MKPCVPFLYWQFTKCFHNFIWFSSSSSFLISSFKSFTYKWLISLSVSCPWYPQSALFSSCVNATNAVQKGNGERQSPCNIPHHICMGCDCITFCSVLNEALCSISLLTVLQNLTILLFTATSCIDFILSYVECCQMLSGNEYRLHLNSCSSSCSPHLLLLMSLTDPCKIYFLFALLAVNSALPNMWIFFWLFHLWSVLTYLLTYSMGQSPSWEANWFCS